MSQMIQFVIDMLIFPKKMITDGRLEKYKFWKYLFFVCVGIMTCSYINVVLHPEFENFKVLSFGFGTIILAAGILIEIVFMYVIVKMFRVKELTFSLFIRYMAPYLTIQSLLEFVIISYCAQLNLSILGNIVNSVLHFWMGYILYILLKNYKQSIRKSIFASLTYSGMSVLLVILKI